MTAPTLATPNPLITQKQSYADTHCYALKHEFPQEQRNSHKVTPGKLTYKTLPVNRIISYILNNQC